MNIFQFFIPIICAILASCENYVNNTISVPIYSDPHSFASDPGGLKLSESKLEFFKEELQNLDLVEKMEIYPNGMLDEHLRFGDSRAAIVVRTHPAFIVAAYTDELDCIVLLKFDRQIAEKYDLKSGDRLLTVNTYVRGKGVSQDLTPGPKSFGRYRNVYPLIAEFLSDDMDKIMKRKKEISEVEYSRLIFLVKNYYMNKNQQMKRKGSPYFSKGPENEPLDRGLIHLKKGEYSQAIKEYTKAIGANPNYMPAFNNRGNAYKKMGQLDRAIQDYDQAIKLVPGYALAFRNRGLTYFAKGQYERAIKDYDEAIRLRPNYAMSFNNRGDAYRKLGEQDRAIEDYDEAIRLKSTGQDVSSEARQW